MWIDDDVTYTPEVIQVTKGDPIKAKVISVGMDGTLRIRFPDGEEKRVEARLCEKL